LCRVRYAVPFRPSCVNDGLSDGDQAVGVTLSAAGFDPVVVGVVNADND